MVITRSKTRFKQTLDRAASPRANPPGSASALNQSIPQQPSHEEGVGSSTQDLAGCLTTSLTAGSERHSAVRKCRAYCLSCPNLSIS